MHAYICISVCVYIHICIYFHQTTKEKNSHSICIKAPRSGDTSSLLQTRSQQQLSMSGKCLREQNEFPCNSPSPDKALPSRAGQGMLRAGFVLWHLPTSSGKGIGLGGKCFICVPIYSSIVHVAKWLRRASLGKDELPRLGCTCGPQPARPRRGLATLGGAARGSSNVGKVQRMPFPLEKRVS